MEGQMVIRAIRREDPEGKQIQKYAPTRSLRSL